MVCTFFCVKPIPKITFFRFFLLCLYQSRKVDTKNIIFRFSFSKVDMSHIFAEYIFSKVDTRDIFSRFLFLKVDIYPASAEKSCGCSTAAVKDLHREAFLSKNSICSFIFPERSAVSMSFFASGYLQWLPVHGNSFSRYRSGMESIAVIIRQST